MALALGLAAVAACKDVNPRFGRGAPAGDGAPTPGADAGPRDADPRDADPPDADPPDAGPPDAGPPEVAACAPSGCSDGRRCEAGRCQAIAGLVLHFPFEEADGAIAMDASPTRFHGTFIGEVAPAPSDLVPLLEVATSRSRAFVLENASAVRAVGLPAPLRPPNVSVSVWYRTTRTDFNGTNVGSELVSLGDNFVVRVAIDQIEVGKQVSASGGTFVKCFARISGGVLVDGRWHHVAAVTGADGMRVYFDGTTVCSNVETRAVVYTESQDLWVGHHALQQRGRFDGNIDEVRIYARALTSDEVTWLAGGGQ
jgi:hypothetical protein